MMTKTKLTKQDVAKLQRVTALEKAIVKALKRFGVTLKAGYYMEGLGQPYACVCAIGAALLTRIPEYFGVGAAKDLERTLRNYRMITKADRISMTEWASSVVNDGITKEDLLQLEEGFEGAATYRDSTPLVAPDRSSPFWKLGRKLGRRADRGK